MHVLLHAVTLNFQFLICNFLDVNESSTRYHFSYLEADWEVTKCDEVKQGPEHKSMLPSGKQVTLEPV